MDPSVHVPLLHSGCSGFGSFGLATCSSGMVTGSWGLQQNVAMEKNVNKWQCRQLCIIPAASSTGATSVRLVPPVANMHSQKNASTTGIIRV